MPRTATPSPAARDCSRRLADQSNQGARNKTHRKQSDKRAAKVSDGNAGRRRLKLGYIGDLTPSALTARRAFKTLLKRRVASARNKRHPVHARTLPRCQLCHMGPPQFRHRSLELLATRTTTGMCGNIKSVNRAPGATIRHCEYDDHGNKQRQRHENSNDGQGHDFLHSRGPAPKRRLKWRPNSHYTAGPICTCRWGHRRFVAARPPQDRPQHTSV